jgi:phage terminase large subunit-like protein
MITETQLRRWRKDPVSFMETLCDPDNEARPFRLYKEQEQFIREGFTVTPQGRLPYAELVYSAPKKSGKTTLGAMAMIYVIAVLAGKYGEGYCVANDLDQSVGRVFKQCARILECSPAFKNAAKITADTILFHATQGTITAIASDYRGAAGSSPNFIVFDELWAVTSEDGMRLWDECVISPTKAISARLVVTYAGFSGESTLLENLIQRGLRGELIA